MRPLLPATTRARFALIICITFIPVFASTFFSYLQEKRVLLSHINEDVMRITRVAAGTQEIAINSAFQLLTALAANIPKDNSRLQLLARLQNENPIFKTIGFAASDGTRLCTSSIWPEIDFAGRMEEKMEFAVDAWTEGSAPKSGLIISHYFRYGTPECKGVLFVLLDMGLFFGFTGVQLPDDAEYLLITEKGIALAASRETQNPARQDSPLIDTILSRREGTAALKGLGGSLRLYAFKPLSNIADTGIYITVGLPTSIYSEMDNILAIDLLVILISFLSGLLIWTLTDRTLIRKVNSLVDTARKLSAGDMKARTGLRHQPGGEIERVAESLDQLAETLEQRTSQLDSYQEQLWSMASELLLTEERERRRIATEMHDRIGQSLAISKTKLGALVKSSTDSATALQLHDLRNYINQAIRDTRSIIYKISSPILYELGLEAALEWLAEQIQTEHGITSSFRSDQQEKPLEESVRTLLFQALNELLVNVVKHSQAGRVSVSCTREGDFVRIEVDDDGVGFEPAAGVSGRKLAAGFGLFSIRERLNYVKGTLEVISSPGKGTRIIMKAPLKKTEVGDNQ
ncbi:MAG: ATP-binding protein [Syntrophobacteraceae bacterium]